MTELNQWEMMDDYNQAQSRCENCLCTLELIKDINKKLRFLEEQNERNYSLLQNIENRIRNKEIIELNQSLRRYPKCGNAVSFIPTPKPPLSTLFDKDKHSI